MLIIVSFSTSILWQIDVYITDSKNRLQGDGYGVDILDHNERCTTRVMRDVCSMDLAEWGQQQSQKLLKACFSLMWL